ncbi:MAG: pomA [Rickettsiaceae bacterium]|jgi:chemotaxis protein MotA|nr:pomA [Rickettsiaceae bacterium]
MRKIELSTIIGILAALIILYATISFSGKIKDFLDIPSILLVVGGTFFVTAACFSFKEVILAQRSIISMIALKPHDPHDIAASMLNVSEVAYKRGLLNLEKNSFIKDQVPFFYKHLNMVIDGEKAPHVQQIMDQEIVATHERYLTLISILKKAAEVAPSMGLIGTIIGLVQMLGSLNDVKMIGPAMAIALLTTFYGAILSYIMLFPLASKFEKNLVEELLNMRIYLITLTSMANNEHPTKLEALLNSILPPEKKVVYFKR